MSDILNSLRNKNRSDSGSRAEIAPETGGGVKSDILNSLRNKSRSDGGSRAEIAPDSGSGVKSDILNSLLDSSRSDGSSRAALFEKLQAITNKIHAASNIDEVMLGLSKDICSIFNADRLMIYRISEDKASIFSKVKSGFGSFKKINLPISDQSIAGYVGLTKKLLNIHDVYDEQELNTHNPPPHFLLDYHRSSGYRAKEMLVAPVVDAQQDGELLGVVQLVNHKSDVPFPAVAEEGIKALCESLAIAFVRCQQATDSSPSDGDSRPEIAPDTGGGAKSGILSSLRDGSRSDGGNRVALLEKLQAITDKIHAASNIDEIMLGLSKDICSLFNVDRLAIYTVSEDQASLVSKVKIGLDSSKRINLPISDQSIAGYVGLTKKILNIRDVYDEQELNTHNPPPHFLQDYFRGTGYRAKEMLVAPVVDAQQDGALLGVVQFVNHKSGLPFPAVAEDGIKALCESLAIAFVQCPQTAKSKYDHLVADAVLSLPQLELAAHAARSKNIDVEEVLITEFKVKQPVLGAALSKHFGVPYEPFRPDRIKLPDLLKNLRRDYVEQNQWLPIDETGEGIVILTLDPERVKSSRVVNNIFPKRRLSYRVTTVREFGQSVDQLFSAKQEKADSVGDMLSVMDETESETESVIQYVSNANDNELVRLVNKVIVDAYHQGASDIHIEPLPGKEKTLIRFRKDGSLVKYIEVPSAYRDPMAARIKIMSDLDISERRKPQDGKIKFRKFGPLDIELRVVTIPTAGGVEGIVLRILSAGKPLPLDNMGMQPDNLERLKFAISKPYGLFFVCGPTGSGKTTTLHSILNFLNTPDTKIWTAEDPVEITQRGLHQVQLNKKAGLDFPTIMKAFLRADPDIIMVGEMRDKETTSIGIEASLTGHMVFATLHTNSAPESIIRLLDMGMDPFNFADALLGILAQRLAKRLCKCKETYIPTPEEERHLIEEFCEELRNTENFKKDPEAGYDAIRKELVRQYGNDTGQLSLCRSKGCAECDDTGYKGRCGLHELMIGTDPVKKLIVEHARVAELFAASLEDGMRTLKMDGIEKVLQGITDMKQVHAVCIR